MTTRGPNFHELVGEELEPEEEARLRRVHDLLLQAGPPAEVPPALATPALEAPKGRLLPQRRRGAALLLAAALAAAAFGAGYFFGDRNESVNAFDSVQTVRLHGTRLAPRALATVQVGKRDGSGNLPMLVTAQGLNRLPNASDYYTLALTKKGVPVVTCGTFRIGSESATTVRMAVAYDVNRFDGWVITEYKHGRKAEPVMLSS
jgi:hypothetical protein